MHATPATTPDATTQGFTVGRFMTPMPHTIGRDQPLARAHEVMRKYTIRHLPVLDGGRLVGLVSARDLLFVETLPDVEPRATTVEEAMSQDLYVTPPEAPLAEVARAMAERHCGSAVVVERGAVVGIFTAIDALRVLSDVLEGAAQSPPRA